MTRAGDVEFPAGVTKAFREIAPALFEDIKLTVDQDLTLKNLARIIPSIKSLEVFYSSLSDEHFRRIILTLCSKATRFVDYLTAEPLLLDLIISPDRLLDMNVYISDSLSLSLLKQFNEIKLGLLYLLDQISLAEVHAKWSSVAERFLIDTIEEVMPKGRPHVIAGGKFGSREMSFMSDLDLLFILPDSLKQKKPAIERKSPEIQKRLLDSNGSPVFAIDLKLRPEGKSAPLLMTVSEYKVYLEKRLSVWETMAMTRFRSIFPSEEIEEIIGNATRNVSITRRSIEEIAALYGKVVQSKSYFDEIDVKSGDGGIFAVEFLVQTLLLANIRNTGRTMPASASIIDSIVSLKQNGTLPEQAADEVRESYEFYRMIEFSNYVSLSKTNHKIPHDERELESLAAHLDFKNSAEFLDSRKARMRKISSLFKKTISQLIESAD